jgi:hypothetical protein
MAVRPRVEGRGWAVFKGCEKDMRHRIRNTRTNIRHPRGGQFSILELGCTDLRDLRRSPDPWPPLARDFGHVAWVAFPSNRARGIRLGGWVPRVDLPRMTNPYLMGSNGCGGEGKLRGA